MSLLAANQVSKIYQMGSTNVAALNEVSMEVREGEFVAIQGTSGSGKSTLLNMLGGLDHPTKGEVYFARKPLGPFTKREMARYRRFSVGMIFQNFNLIPTMSARENVALALAFGGMRGQLRRTRSTELLDRVGLGDRLTHRPAELSGGEQQRVAIARALANNPKVLLADEPTGNLDETTGKQIIDLLFAKHAERGMTLVLVTHDNGLAQRCHRVVRLRSGRVDTEGVGQNHAGVA